MPRGQLKNYKIGKRSYSITQLLGYEGVREVVSSRKTEGSKRELLRDLRKHVIVPRMLTNQGAAGPSTYGAQRARAGEPIRTNAGSEAEGPRHFHDPFYEGPYNPNSPPPMDRRYGGQKNGPLRNNKGQIIYGPRKRRSRLGRGTMYFNGVRMSASRARQTFPRLVRRLMERIWQTQQLKVRLGQHTSRVFLSPTSPRLTLISTKDANLPEIIQL